MTLVALVATLLSFAGPAVASADEPRDNTPRGQASDEPAEVADDSLEEVEEEVDPTPAPGECWIAPNQLGLNANWHSVLGASSYELVYKTDETDWALVPDGARDIDFPSWHDSELEVRVRGVFPDGAKSDWTPCGLQVLVTSEAPTCGATARPFGINVTWEDNEESEGWQIRTVNAAGEATRTDWLDADLNEYVVSPITEAVTVMLRNRVGRSGVTPWMTCGQASPTIPPAPSCGVEPGFRTLTVSWPGSEHLEAAQIRHNFRGTDIFSEWVAESPYVINSDVQTEVWLRVRYAGGHETDWVSCGVATPETPTAPTCTLTGVVGGAEVIWSATSHTDSYTMRSAVNRSFSVRSGLNTTSADISANRGPIEAWVRAHYIDGSISAWQYCGSVNPVTNTPTCTAHPRRMGFVMEFDGEYRRVNWSYTNIDTGRTRTGRTSRSRVWHLGHGWQTVDASARFRLQDGSWTDWVACGQVRFYDPLVVDLGGDGIATTDIGDSVNRFDLLGTGEEVMSGWITNQDGFLAVDDGDGIITGLDELFGGDEQGDALAQLATFDSNGDGVVDAEDDRWSELGIWVDFDEDHTGDPGELRPVSDYGITSFSLATDGSAEMDANGNVHADPIEVGRADGTTTTAADLFFAYDLD